MAAAKQSSSKSSPKAKPRGQATAQPRKGRATQKQLRALAILEELKRLYPEAPCSLDFENPLQLMIATMLAAQCTDERVNQVTPALFDRYPDVEAFAGADLEELEKYVKSTGFYRNKAKNIRLNCQRLLEVYGGEVPQTMEHLTSLAGVARKTANVVLAHGFGINGGVTVDTHVKRITNLLKLTKSDNPVQIERDLMKLLPSRTGRIGRFGWCITGGRFVWRGGLPAIAARSSTSAHQAPRFWPAKSPRSCGENLGHLEKRPIDQLIA